MITTTINLPHQREVYVSPSRIPITRAMRCKIQDIFFWTQVPVSNILNTLYLDYEQKSVDNLLKKVSLEICDIVKSAHQQKVRQIGADYEQENSDITLFSFLFFRLKQSGFLFPCETYLSVSH